MIEVTICLFFFFFQAEDGIRDVAVTGVQTCALPISVGGVCSCCPPCSPPTKVRPGVNHALPETKVTEVTNGNPVCHFCPNPLKWSDCCGARAEFSRPTR